MTTLDQTTIHTLQERYPFSEQELELLDRCFQTINDPNRNDGFLEKLALASPYSCFFLPGDAMRERIVWLEAHVLPAGFASELRAAMSSDAFVDYANQGTGKTFERFLEGVADTGRRGEREALRFAFKMFEEPTPEDVIDVCVRLTIASEALMAPSFDKASIVETVSHVPPSVRALSESLHVQIKGKPLTLQCFVEWAEAGYPVLSTGLSTFVHGLIFHSLPYPKGRLRYERPRLDKPSEIMKTPHSQLLTVFSMMSHELGGPWHRLYSVGTDGHSFNRLEWSILGYGGPTVVLVKTTNNAILGAYASTPWKEARDFQGRADCFLFQLEPKVRVFGSTGAGENFMYLHSDFFDGPLAPMHRVQGLGFGGSLAQPRFFIPETMERGTADFLDRTFETGDLLPADALEEFEISSIEVWAVGGEEIIKQGLEARAKHRELTENAILRARHINDKTDFVSDLKSGVVPSRVFAHKEDVRGRAEFRVDEKHGGYILEH